jgi:SAM-dependent methyltransferase
MSERIGLPGYPAPRQILAAKPALRMLYTEFYSRYAECLQRCPGSGLILEVGSGGGFAKEIIRQLVSSDIVAYGGLDLLLNAERIPFLKNSLRLVCLLNVFHHLSDPECFLDEVWRCLRPLGRVIMVDQHPGWPGRLIYRYGHHERFDMKAERWRSDLRRLPSDANGAIPWIVFQRDLQRFEQRFPGFRLVRYQPHTPLRYWLSGGLKKWSLLPGWAFSSMTRLDNLLIKGSPRFGSFVDIELVKTP